MHAEMDTYEWDTRTHPAEFPGPLSTSQNAGRVSFSPPRLVPLANAAPVAQSPATIADLYLPAGRVHEYAAAYTQEARGRGIPHSMQLWREGCQSGIVALARVATAVPDSAHCDALFWQLEGEDYHVSATFSMPARRVSH